MRRVPLAGLAAILPKTVASCLSSAPALPYNWDEKLRGLILGIALSRSLVLQSIAQTCSSRVKTTENMLSAFLAQDRLKLDGPQLACVKAALKRIRRRRIWKRDGKVAVVLDSTSHGKPRSRGKKRAMPGKGKVRVQNLRVKETILVPGYQEIWIGILLADRTVLPLTRRLWTECGPDCASLNLVELAEISRAIEIVKEVLELDVILVADSGFRRKDLLHWLKKVEGIDFVIRLVGNLYVELDGKQRLLEKTSLWWPKRTRLQWRDGAKHVLLSDVSARRVGVTTQYGDEVSFNALCLTPTKEGIDPMFLATTLTTETVADLTLIVRLYSWRWGIETFFWKFKQGLNAKSWRVFSCWKAIDRLLTAAHIVYLVLFLIEEMIKRGRTRKLRLMMRRLQDTLRERFARPPEMTMGRFLRLIAEDFPSPRRMEAAL